MDASPWRFDSSREHFQQFRLRGGNHLFATGISRGEPARLRRIFRPCRFGRKSCTFQSNCLDHSALGNYSLWVTFLSKPPPGSILPEKFPPEELQATPWMVEISQPSGEFHVTHEVLEREEIQEEFDSEPCKTTTLVSLGEGAWWVFRSWTDCPPRIAKDSLVGKGSLPAVPFSGQRPVRLLRLLHSYLTLFGDAQSSCGGGAARRILPNINEVNSSANPAPQVGQVRGGFFSVHAPSLYPIASLPA